MTHEIHQIMLCWAFKKKKTQYKQKTQKTTKKQFWQSSSPYTDAYNLLNLSKF